VESVSLLARHFRRELDEFEMQTYVTGLRDQTPERVALACQRALTTMKRMPVLAELRELANQKTENVLSLPYWKREPIEYATSGLMVEIRDIGQQIARDRYGKPYSELSSDELLDCAGEAQRIRLRRLKEKQHAV